jgi:hypothetical protein
MLQHLWINHPDRVLRPIHYSSLDALIASLDEKITARRGEVCRTPDAEGRDEERGACLGAISRFAYRRTGTELRFRS